MSTHGSQTRWASFSGIDGAGKTTQIEALRMAAELAGLSVRIIRFWDDVARLTGLRETSGHKLFKGDKGVGSPQNPLHRRDKNVRSWPMSCARLLLYAVDAVSTRLAAARALRSGADLVIFDRYLYDELANLNLKNKLMRVYVRLLMKLVPRPDASFILDANPVEARARKPEYPLEFLYVNRQAYLELSRLIGGMIVVAPGPPETVSRDVLACAQRAFGSGGLGRRQAHGASGAETAAMD